MQSNFLTCCPTWARVFSLISQSPVTSAGLSTLSSNTENNDAGWQQDAPTTSGLELNVADNLEFIPKVLIE